MYFPQISFPPSRMFPYKGVIEVGKRIHCVLKWKCLINWLLQHFFHFHSLVCNTNTNEHWASLWTYLGSISWLSLMPINLIHSPNDFDNWRDFGDNCSPSTSIMFTWIRNRNHQFGDWTIPAFSNCMVFNTVLFLHRSVGLSRVVVKGVDWKRRKWVLGRGERKKQED